MHSNEDDDRDVWPVRCTYCANKLTLSIRTISELIPTLLAKGWSLDSRSNAICPGPHPSAEEVARQISREAGASIDKARLRGLVLSTIKSVPTGLTCDEFEMMTGFAHQTASPRFTELSKAKKIVWTGERRKTRSGRTAMVWAVTA